MRFSTLGEWLTWQETLHPRSIDLGLDRVRSVYGKLGLHESSPITMTVGGTNGKGSSVCYLASMLRAQGYRVGSYTSPHLVRYNERICIDGMPVDDEAICRAFAAVDAARGDITLSFFEFGTLAALAIFAAERVDVRVLEVGLGGRLDAVNLVDADVVLLTSIGLDHQDWLGATREEIGLEKAGVMRRGRPAVIADGAPPASVLAHAKSLDIDLSVVGRDFDFSERALGWDWWSGRCRFDDLPRPLLEGSHQLRNAAGALAAIHLLGGRLPVREAAIRRGMAEASLHGRFQVIDGNVPLVLDVAHNVQAASVLAGQLRERFPGRTIHAVFALMRDKDLAGVVEQMKGVIAAWYLPRLQVPRAASPESLSDVLRSSGMERVECAFEQVIGAVEAARDAAAVGDVIVVFGSFFLVAEYLAQQLELRG